MNILIPDSWLRQYLKTKATPKDIQRCLSLCGPSIEKTHTVGLEIIYEVEVTTNRVDSFSVYGLAREASAILPEFGIKAELLPLKFSSDLDKQKSALDIQIIDQANHCRRILAIRLSGVALGPSPKWLQTRLEMVGQRPLNNIIDITNYVMWETGHPIHAFDYDRLKQKRIIVREAKKSEHLITLDGKRHTLCGGEIVFDNGTGEIIDLPGIMGTANTVVTEKTKNVLLFIENSDPAKIRYASMGLSISTQAATINEKDPDPELAHATINRAVDLACDITKATIGSTLFDHYPVKPQPVPITLSHERLISYLGSDIIPQRVCNILQNLGFSVNTSSKKPTVLYEATPPSWRLKDITIPEDIIEEVARIFGYRNISSKLPDTEPPMVMPNSAFSWEEEVKIRLRDWGYTELYTYSMISEEQMDWLELDKQKAYKIANPLSSDWVYMRPVLWPSVLAAVRENLKHHDELRVFELSMTYRWNSGNLPTEYPILLVVWSGDKLLEAKGLAEAIFNLFGITFPEPDPHQPLDWYEKTKHLALGKYGSVGLLRSDLQNKIGLAQPVTILDLLFPTLVADANPIRAYRPIPKYPPIIEDLAFTVPDRFQIGPLMASLKSAHPLVAQVTLLDTYENTRTLRITYQDPTRNLTNEDVQPVGEKLVQLAHEKFGVTLKTI